MSEEISKRQFMFLQKSLCDKAEAIYKVMEEHAKLSSVITGKICETMLSQTLKPYIPSPYKVDCGEIISSHGETSGECDIVIYCNPVLFQEENIVVVPDINVKAIIQVQKNLGAYDDLKKIIKRCRKQRKFASPIFVVYAWFLEKEELGKFKEEIEEEEGKLFVFSYGFKDLINNELYKLVKEIQSKC